MIGYIEIQSTLLGYFKKVKVIIPLLILQDISI